MDLSGKKRFKIRDFFPGWNLIEYIGLRGFAGLVASAAQGRVPLAHLGITDPRVAPSEGHPETWAFFGLTAPALIAAAKGLS